MDKVTTVGIDLAKRVFALHGVNAAGRVSFAGYATGMNWFPIIAQLPPCLIGMEASSGSHEWARQFARFGHTVRLMAPKVRAPKWGPTKQV